ncbi:BnaAnng32100D [Brassica napus]|uniref:BnaAnng32100D protein n=3 Tax=Brassica TaxID=3705 RepID=A0A078JU13_BRANA|nr:BnaAnng32100D [Brassica napus]
MANSYTLLANLRAGRCSNTAEVRLLRFWEARNINKGGELMSIELLLIDEAERTGSGGISAIQLSSEHNANNEDVRFELKDLHPDDPQIVVFKHGVGELRGSSK